MEHHVQLARRSASSSSCRETVLDALVAAYEQWDGRGWPNQVAGEDVPLASRVAQLAEYVEVAHRVGGVDAAKALARDRSGRQFDPTLADLVCADGDLLLSGLDDVDTWQAVVAAEPALAVVLSGERFDAALAAIATFIDLKSPYFLGHSIAVAELAAAAGRQLGWRTTRSARCGAPGSCTISAVSASRTRSGTSAGRSAPASGSGSGSSPYLTERMLQPVRAARAAGRDRRPAPRAPRRLGLPARPVGRGDLAPGAHPGRRRRLPGDARAAPAPRRADRRRRGRAQLRAEVTAGRLDGDAVEAVLGAAGHRVPRRREGPAGLTAREVEVLQLLARGLSNKAIATRLVISPKTVANHVEHIYAKIDASSRAAAGLFAVQHGLLPEDGVNVS